MEKDYLTFYEAFMNTYNSSEVSGAVIGEVAIRMASYYARYNLTLAKTMNAYHVVIRDFQVSTDEASGKPMSSAKAEAMAAATPEADAYQSAKIDVQNCEQLLNALKSLQRGAINEYSYQA